MPSTVSKGKNKLMQFQNVEVGEDPTVLQRGQMKFSSGLGSVWLWNLVPVGPGSIASSLGFHTKLFSILEGLVHFTFLPAVYEGCIFSTSLSTLVIVCHLNYNHPGGVKCILTVYVFLFLSLPCGLWI